MRRGRPRKPVKIVWLGSDDEPDMLETVWNEVTFLRGVPYETNDPYFIDKARGSRFYEVID